jgi:ATP-dependent DNA helicase DinG
MTYSLPSWTSTLRPHQLSGIEEILAAFDAGAKYVLLEAPPGAGKTLIADIVRQELDERAIYVCTNKSLQDQVECDFPAYPVLKGRDNYLSQRPPATCADCNKSETRACSYCEVPSACAYPTAKRRAAAAPCCVLNTSYFLSETNWTARSTFSGYPFVILDEADLLQGELSRHIEIPLTATLLADLKVKPVGKHAHRDKWQAWVTDDVLPALNKRIDGLRSLKDKATLQEERRLRSFLRIRSKLVGLTISANWVRTGWLDRECIFKPIEIDTLAKDALWRHADRWLLMSGSFLSPDMEAAWLGIPDGEWASVSIPSTFPAANRPVYPICKYSMSRSERDVSLPFVAGQLSQIMKRHPESRILVHVNSYQNARALHDLLQSSPRITSYFSARDRDRALRWYKKHPGAVLIAASMERGVDLPDEACDVCVVAKVPYPYLGDSQVSARMRLTNGRVWYSLETIRTVVQATQRGVRHVNDTCTTYILDKDWLRLYEEWGKYFPKWWKDAINFGSSGIR